MSPPCGASSSRTGVHVDLLYRKSPSTRKRLTFSLHPKLRRELESLRDEEQQNITTGLSETPNPRILYIKTNAFQVCEALLCLIYIMGRVARAVAHAFPGIMELSRRMTALSPFILLVLRSSFGALTDIESQFIEVPSADGARESLRFITSKPHTAGTPGDLEVSLACG